MLCHVQAIFLVFGGRSEPICEEADCLAEYPCASSDESNRDHDGQRLTAKLVRITIK